MHPNASESGSYIKASIVFTVRMLLLSHTYLHGENIVCSLRFTLTKLWLGSGKTLQFFAILLGLFNQLVLIQKWF